MIIVIIIIIIIVFFFFDILLYSLIYTLRVCHFSRRVSFCRKRHVNELESFLFLVLRNYGVDHEISALLSFC